MEIRVLRYFLTIVRTESITKAAEALHITQPTLSRQIAQLEDEIGTPLFYRGAKKLKLTPEGALLKSRAEEIVGLADKTLADLQTNHQTVEGQISIGSGITRASAILAEMMTGFRRQYPKVSFILVSSTAENVRYQLERGLLDFGVLLEPADLSDLSFLRFPAVESWRAVMLNDDPLAQKQAVTPEDLQNRELILPRRGAVISELYQWLRKDPEELNIFCYNTLGGQIPLLVKESGTISLSVEGSIPFLEGSYLTSVPLDPPIRSTSVIAWKRNTVMSPAAEHFVEYISCFSGMEQL